MRTGRGITRCTPVFVRAAEKHDEGAGYAVLRATVGTNVQIQQCPTSGFHNTSRNEMGIFGRDADPTIEG